MEVDKYWFYIRDRKTEFYRHVQSAVRESNLTVIDDEYAFAFVNSVRLMSQHLFSMRNEQTGQLRFVSTDMTDVVKAVNDYIRVIIPILS